MYDPLYLPAVHDLKKTIGLIGKKLREQGIETTDEKIETICSLAFSSFDNSHWKTLKNQFIPYKRSENNPVYPFSLLVKLNKESVDIYVNKENLVDTPTNYLDDLQKKFSGTSKKFYKAIKFHFDKNKNIEPTIRLMAKLKGKINDHQPDYLSIQEFKNEMEIFEIFSELEGIAELDCWGTYIGNHTKIVNNTDKETTEKIKAKTKKIVCFSPLYNRKDLHNFLCKIINEKMDLFNDRKNYLKMVQPLCQSLVKQVAYIHKCGFLHLDIKSENIFVEEVINNDDGSLVYIGHIGDFGCATEFATNKFKIPERHRKLGSFDFFSVNRFEMFCDDTLPLNLKPSDDVWGIGEVIYNIIHLRSSFFSNLQTMLYKSINTYSALEKESRNKPDDIDIEEQKEKCIIGQNELLSHIDKCIEEMASEKAPRNKNTFKYLFWRIFRPNDPDPITAKEVGEMLPAIFENEIALIDKK